MGIFKDVYDKAWYAKDVYEANRLGLMTGLKKDLFGVGQVMKREEQAVALVRMYKLIVNGFAGVVEKVIPAVVEINTGGSIGSGTIIAQDLVLTNAHVVEDQQEVYLLAESKIFDGADNIKGTIISKDKVKDVALIKINVKNKLPVLELITQAEIGENVLAIGNPLGYTDTITHGIVSKFTIRKGYKYIQTDAAINPGNSGGALINTKGQLIGIPSQTFMDFKGISFALSVQEVKEFLEGNNISGVNIDASK